MGGDSRFASLAVVLREKPESNLRADISHWIRVYRELRAVGLQLGAFDFAGECEERLSFWMAKVDQGRFSLR